MSLSEATGLVQRIQSLWRRYSHVNWALADQALISGINFAMGILLARFMGIEEFGLFAMAWLFIEFAGIFQQAIIVMPMMSIGPKQTKADMAGYLGATVLQQFAFLAVVIVCLTAGTFILRRVSPNIDLTQLLLPLAAAACAHQLQTFLRRYFFTRSRPALAFLNDFVRYGGQTLVILALVWRGEIDTAAVLWSMTGFSVLAVLLGLFSFEKISFSRADLRQVTLRHWHFSKWMTLSETMRWATGDFFLIVAGALLGPTMVGAMRATKNLVGLSHIVQLGLENVIPVRAAQHYQSGGIARLNAYVKKVTLVGTAMIGAVVLVAAVAPEFWLNLVFGSEFAGYGYMVQLWGLTYVISYMGRPLIGALRAIEHTRIIFFAFFATGVLSLAVAYPLVQTFGVPGVLWGLSVIQMLRNGILFAAYRRFLRLKTPDDLSARTSPTPVLE